MTMIDKSFLLDKLDEMFPSAHCELNFSSPFECLVAVSLSAQTTDNSVNRVTPRLFLAYPTPIEMAKADIKEVEEIIHSIGLYHNKAKNIISLSKAIVENFNGEVRLDKKTLTSLPGVGIKTANVVLAEAAHIPSIPVDTHVSRVSIRLGLAKEGDAPEVVEKKLEKIFPKERWIKMHHQLIFLGRRVCSARSPQCETCPLSVQCKEGKKRLSTKGK